MAISYQKTGRTTLCVADTQPIVIEGLKSICAGGNFDFIGGTTSLPDVCSDAGANQPDIWVLDTNFGYNAVHAWIENYNAMCSNGSAVVVWGTMLSEREIFEYTRSGSRGVIRKTAALTHIQACLAFVSAGGTWLETPTVNNSGPEVGARGGLQNSTRFTHREKEVLSFLRQGLTTRCIASELGISYCTVKIHLKNIYRKAGVIDRYTLLNSMFAEVQQRRAHFAGS